MEHFLTFYVSFQRDDNLFEPQMIIGSIFQGLLPVFKMFLIPIILWITIPGLAATALFKNNEAFSFGALLGFIGLITIGHFLHD